jgi:hypothetical protein
MKTKVEDKPQLEAKHKRMRINQDYVKEKVQKEIKN